MIISPLHFPSSSSMAEQRGIPVVAQAQFRLQVIGIRLQALARTVDVIFHLSDGYVSHVFQFPSLLNQFQH